MKIDLDDIEFGEFYIMNIGYKEAYNCILLPVRIYQGYLEAYSFSKKNKLIGWINLEKIHYIVRLPKILEVILD